MAVLHLYETLNEMLKDDISQNFSPEEIRDIYTSVARKVKKKIGILGYSKLEKYVTTNKSDSDLGYVIGYICQDVVESNSELLDLDYEGETKTTIKNEILLGYKIMVELHKTLEACKYNAEAVLLDMWDEDS